MIIFCTYIVNFGVFFSTEEQQDPTGKGHLEARLAPSNNSFMDSKSYEGKMFLSPALSCYNTDQKFSQGLRGDHWVLYNYIKAEKRFQCNESITYTTHGGFEFLDNLEPLLQRWQGPLSIAVYAPGTDFEKTIDAIFYYRECRRNSLVRNFATFHLFFDFFHLPAKIPHWQSLDS